MDLQYLQKYWDQYGVNDFSDEPAARLVHIYLVCLSYQQVEPIAANHASGAYPLEFSKRGSATGKTATRQAFTTGSCKTELQLPVYNNFEEGTLC